MLKVNQLVQTETYRYKYNRDNLQQVLDFTRTAMKGEFTDEVGQPAEFNRDEANVFVALAANPNKGSTPFARVSDDFPVLACSLDGKVYFYKPADIELSEDLVKTFTDNVRRAFDKNSTRNLSIVSTNSEQNATGSVVIFSDNVHVTTPYTKEPNFVFGSQNVGVSNSRNCFIAHARPIDYTFVSDSSDSVLTEPVKVSLMKSKNVVVFYPDLTNYSERTPDLRIYDSNRIAVLEPYTHGRGVEVNASLDIVVMEAGNVRTNNTASGIVYRGSDIEIDDSQYATVVYKCIQGKLEIKDKSNYTHASGRQDSELGLYELYEKYLKSEFEGCFKKRIDSGFELLDDLNKKLAVLGKSLTIKLKLPYPIMELNMERAKKSLSRVISDVSGLL